MKNHRERRVGIIPMILLVLISSLWFPTTAQTAKGRIAGRVISDKNRPLKYARVQLYRVNGDVTRHERETMTDRKGQFVFENLPLGTYKLHAHQSGYLDPTSEGDSMLSVSLEADHGVDDLEIVLKAGNAITGQVTDEDGDPIIGAAVIARRKEVGGYSHAGSAQTDDRGIYRIFNLRPGEYIVSAQAPAHMDRNSAYTVRFFPGVLSEKEAQPIQVSGGTEVADVNIQITAVKGAKLAGRVALRGSDAPIAGARISIYANNVHLSTKSNTDGSYEFSDIPPGDYQVRIEPLDGQAPGTTRQVKVAAQPSTRLDIWLQEGAEIMGRVEMDGQGSLDGMELRVRAQMVAIETQNSFQVKHEDQVSDGTFRFAGLPRGKLRLSIYVPDSRCYLKRVLLGDKDVTDADIPIRSGSKISNLRLIVSGEVGEVRGYQVNAAEPTSFQVVLVPEDPAKWNTPQSYLRGWSDGRNPFVIRGVPAGEYLLFALSNASIDGEASVKKYLPTAIQIEVRAGMVETVQVTPLRVGN